MVSKTGMTKISEKLIKNLYRRSQHFKLIVKCALILILFSSSFADASYNIVKDENIFNESNASKEFSMLYVDGFGANSGGFKMILRTYERRSGNNFKSLLVDIEYILSSQDKVVYSKRVEQIPLSDTNGEIVLTHRPGVALEEGKNYTGMARIYYYKDGIPEYYLTALSVFTARSDAEITEVFGDSIGASATIKSKSMIPLDAKITFTLKKDDVIVGTREVKAPSIMANDKEKTVNILWANNLDRGKYMLSVLLNGKDIIDEQDKILSIEERTAAISNNITKNENTPKTLDFVSGFTIIAILVLVTIIIRWRK